VILLEFKNENLRAKVFGITGKGLIINIKEKVTLYVISAAGEESPSFLFNQKIKR
jgi:hypothetical protein